MTGGSSGASGGAAGATWSESRFEDYDHEQLLAMLQDANAASVSRLAQHMARARRQLDDIADQLAGHINGLEWESRAGEAFKSWARKVVHSADGLAGYADTAARNMSDAAHTLGSVYNGMPSLPEQDIKTVQDYQAQQRSGGSPAPGGTRITAAEAQSAQTRVDSAHREAVTQMEKLGSAYSTSSHGMSTAVPPTFPPTPQTLMPPRPKSPGDTGGGRRPVGGDGGGGAESPSHRGGYQDPGGTSPHGGDGSRTPNHGTPAPEVRPPGTRLDGHPPLHTDPNTPAPGTPPDGPSGNGPGGHGAPQGGSHPPLGVPAGQGLGGSGGRTAAGLGGGRSRYGAGAVGEGEAGSGLGGGRLGGRSGAGAAAAEGEARAGSRGGGYPLGAGGGLGGGGRGGRRGGRQRPDYVVEDEETWSSQQGEHNPAVIGEDPPPREES
jgi:hypothetical protein